MPGTGVSSLSGPAGPGWGPHLQTVGPDTRKPRLYPHLDRLRGVAALIVVLHHKLLCLPNSDPLVGQVIGSRVLAVLTLGRPAVILFFVLSGFVLATSLQDRTVEPVVFALRRALRLLPPLWATALFSMIAFELTGGRAATGMSEWLGAQWGPDLSSSDLIRHLAMLPGKRQYPLDHVAWSLTHELRLSLAMPVIVAALRRHGAWPCIAVALLTSVGADLAMAMWPELFPRGYHGFVFDASGGASLVVTLRFSIEFVVGAALALHVPALHARLPGRSAALILGLVGLMVLSQAGEWSMLIGASLIVVAAAKPGMSVRGGCQALTWLGRVSYSLYLIHVPIMLIAARCLPGPSPRVIVAVAVIGSLLCSEVAYRLVEAPSLRLARRLSGVSLRFPARPMSGPTPAIRAESGSTK